MTPEQLQRLGPAFAAYLQRFLFCCDYTQTFDLLEVYCRGLLSDLPRKSAEPIALASGTAVRTLQEFLKDHLWSFRQARTTLQEYVAATLPALPADDLGTVGVVDETGTVKKGTKTPGVQRQWCGEVGKKENCVVTVHLAVARGRFKTLVDADLFCHSLGTVTATAAGKLASLTMWSTVPSGRLPDVRSCGLEPWALTWTG